jgi:hypothetical protein
VLILASINIIPSAFIDQYRLASIAVVLLLATFAYSLNRSVWIMCLDHFFGFKQRTHLARRIYTASMSAVVQKILKGPNADGHQRKVFRTIIFIIHAVYLFHSI